MFKSLDDSTLSERCFPQCTPPAPFLLSRFPWYPRAYALYPSQGFPHPSRSLNSCSVPLLCSFHLESFPHPSRSSDEKRQLIPCTGQHACVCVPQSPCCTVAQFSVTPLSLIHLDIPGSLYPPRDGTQCLTNVCWISLKMVSD